MKTLLKVFFVVATGVALPMVVNADIAWTGAANDGGNVLTSTNWDGGTAPTSTDTAIIGDAPDAVLSSGTATWKLLTIGSVANQTGTLKVTGGELNVTPESSANITTITLGGVNNASSVLEIDGGTVNAYSLNTPNYSAANIVNMKSGTLNITRWVDWGRNANGSSTFNQSGGTVNVGYNLWIGRDNSGTGVWNMSGGKLNHTGGTFELGHAAGTTGIFTQSGGDVVAPNGDIRLGINAAGSGTYTLDDGTVRPKYWLIVGRDGTGRFVHNDGDVTLVDGDNKNGNWLVLGQHSSGNGTYVMNGGSIVVATGEKGGGIFAGEAGTGRFELNGGTVTTPTITKETGTSTVVLNGGTIKVARDGGTASSDHASDIGILKNIDRLVFGRGTTIDTNGHDTKIVGCGHDTIAGSSLVKTGTGTLTVETLPPVETLIVSNGTLAVDSGASSYTPAIAPALAHRWSFTSDYTDSVTGDAAVQIGSNVALSDGKVTMSGTTHGTGHLNLGTNLVDTTAATIEIWGSQDEVNQWGRIFDYGYYAGKGAKCNYISMAWANNGDSSKDLVVFRTSGSDAQRTDSMAPFTLGKQYHIVVTIQKNGNTTTVRWLRHDPATGELDMNTTAVNTLSKEATIADYINPVLLLGGSQWSTDYDAKATYDEVRVWNCVFSDEAIAKSVAYGPDATTAQLATLTETSLEVASGATLDLGGNSFSAPTLAPGGTLANGTLTVTKSLKLTAGQTITVASGATLDLTGVTDVSITNPEDMPDGGWTFATSSSGGIPAAEPIRLSGDLAGYYLYLKGNKATIGKPGLMIFVM